MGTNYYVIKNECKCCNRYDEEYHIGKESGGWAFSFQGYPWNNLTSWQAWKAFLKDKHIKNEYGETIPYDEFVKMVETYLRPGYKNEKGRVNLQHNVEGRNKGWFNPERDWDDPEGYSFTTVEFS